MNSWSPVPRYGSLGESGLSYTHMEYQYAKKKNIPTIAFLHRDPETIPTKYSESTPEMTEKLNNFRKELQNDHCKYWNEVYQLDGLVSRSLYHLIQNNIRPGWIRPTNIINKKDKQYSTVIESIEKILDTFIYSLNLVRPEIYYRALISVADFDKNIRRTLCGINIRNDPEAHVGVPMPFGTSGKAFTSGYIACDDIKENSENSSGIVWSQVRSVSAVPLRGFDQKIIATLNVDSTSDLKKSGLSDRHIQGLIAKISSTIEPLVAQIFGAKP